MKGAHFFILRLHQQQSSTTFECKHSRSHMVEFKPSPTTKAKTQTRRLEKKKLTKTRSKAVRTKTKQTETLIRNDANALLENRADRARLMQMRKNVVCAVEQPEYDAAQNDDQFKFLPERCHKKEAMSTHSKKRSLTRQGSRLESKPLNVLLQAERSTISSLATRYPANPIQTALLTKQLTFDQQQKIIASHVFLNDNFEKMISMRLIKSTPDPVQRVNDLFKVFNDGVFTRPGWETPAESTRRRMFALLRIHYDNIM